MPGTAIIFGSSGQDGFYLTRLFENGGINVVGVSRNSLNVQGDVADSDFVRQLVKDTTPAYVIHLAANSSTKHEVAIENHRTISTGSINVLEAVKQFAPKARVFITGSGVQFRNDGSPISERGEFEANSAYSVARIHSVHAARYYRSLGIRAYVGYLFHHESPLRKPHHVSQKIAQAVLRISRGSDEILKLGDVSVEKEWTFAGDVAAGIMCLLEQDQVFEAAIGSGVVHSIEDWLVQCFGLVGKNWTDHVQMIEKFTPEYQRLVSNPATINSLGWRPQVDLAGLASMMIRNCAGDDV